MSANDEKRNLERKEELEKEMKPLDERETAVWNAMQEKFGDEFKYHPEVQRSTLIRFIRGIIVWPGIRSWGLHRSLCS